MADDEILRRLDEHMARGNEIMERNTEVMERNTEVIAEIRQEMADVRLELRQWSLRGERVTQGVLAELAAGRAEHVEGRRVLAELRADIRAQTQGLLALIDEMRGGGPAAASA